MGIALNKDFALDYSGLLKLGRLTLEPRDDLHGLDGLTHVRVVMEGFEFADAGSCRENSVRIMTWARDLLDSQIKASIACVDCITMIDG